MHILNRYKSYIQQRLPKEVAKAWSKHLLSGKFRQIQRRMYSPDQDAFCCLGVLAYKTYEVPLNILESIQTICVSDKYVNDETFDLFNSEFIPLTREDQLTYFGFTKDTLCISLNGIFAFANDRDALSFQQIGTFLNTLHDEHT